MVDLSVIILTKNEELHIKRCIENIACVAKEIFVIDCYSIDNTVSIAESLNGFNDCKVTVMQHEWPVTKYAGQFNWALENAPIKTKWVMRFDADEYLLPELIAEINQKLPFLPEIVTSVVMSRRVMFLGRWMKRGTYPVKMLRIFQYGKGFCEQKLMDEHIQMFEGDSVEFVHDFVDDNLHNLSWFIEKHNGYAIREAVDLLDIEYDLTGQASIDSEKKMNEQAKAKRKKKHKYASMPLFWRSFAYFVYRYFFRGAFLEGKEGFLWSFIQGWWYRTIVDAKIYEIKRKSGNDKAMIIQILKDDYNIVL